MPNKLYATLLKIAGGLAVTATALQGYVAVLNGSTVQVSNDTPAITHSISDSSVQEKRVSAAPTFSSGSSKNQISNGNNGVTIQIDGSPDANVSGQVTQGDQYSIEGNQTTVQGDQHNVEGEQTNIQGDQNNIKCGDGGTAYNCGGNQSNDFRGSAFDNSTSN